MLAVFIFFGLCFGCTSVLSCQFRAYGDSGVCVCTEKECDTIGYVWPSHSMEYVMYTSSKSGERFTVTKGNFTTLSTQPSSQKIISINRLCRFQQMVGWGMALTGAVSINLNLMTPKLREYVYRDYYSPEGANFNWLRMPIGGCDFDVDAWQYNLTPMNDTNLSGLNELDPHDVPKVKQIRDLKNVSGIGENLKVMFSAWTPPPWMKTNNAFVGTSLLRKEYYQLWADFHIKFLRLMSKNNITAFAITTGNEPMNGVLLGSIVVFPDLGWLATEQGKWVRQNLGPTMRQSEFANVKIFTNDDQRYTLPWWMDMMGKEAMEYVEGIAVHWYADPLFPPILLDSVARQYPDKMLMNTESSSGSIWFDTPGVCLGSWARAEGVFKRVCQDMLHSVTGWIEWNMVLNTKGGPNYVSNYLDSLMIFNETAMEYYKQPWYYVFAHFSKFASEGSVRICADVVGPRRTISNVSMVAFETPNGMISLILSNKSDQPIVVTVTDELRGEVDIWLMERSINTVIYK